MAAPENKGSDERRVSLVIPGRNCTATIRQCLDAVVPLLRPSGAPLSEIIFVDDGSTDQTPQIVHDYPVTCVRGEGGGPGAARNLGWQAAHNELVWFIDSDCVAEPDALALLLGHLDEPRVGGVGGSYANLATDSLLACLIHEEIIGRHRSMPTEVNFLGSFNVVYRRSVLESVDGFDERWVNGPGKPGAEDADLAYRVRAAGYLLHFEPRSRVGHYHPTSLRRYLRAQRIHGRWRVNLHLRHPRTAGGDVYSSMIDHGQPFVALLIVAALPTVAFPATRWVVPALALVLLLMQIPITSSTIRRTRRWRCAAFAPLGIARAFARGFGLVQGLWGALRSRPPTASLP